MFDNKINLAHKILDEQCYIKIKFIVKMFYNISKDLHKIWFDMWVPYAYHDKHTNIWDKLEIKQMYSQLRESKDSNIEPVTVKELEV